MGRRRVYSTRSANANRPKYRTPYKTPQDPQLFPAAPGPADQHPDPGNRYQQPPREPGPDADHRRDGPDGDQGAGDHGPGPGGHRDPVHDLVARVARHQGLVRQARGPPQRLVRQPVQVDDRQVGQQVIDLAQRLGIEGGVHPLMEFLGGQPARGVMLTQQRRGAVAIRVGGADPRITRHRALFLSDQPTPAYLPAFPDQPTPAYLPVLPDQPTPAYLPA